MHFWSLILFVQGCVITRTQSGLDKKIFFCLVFLQKKHTQYYSHNIKDFNYAISLQLIRNLLPLVHQSTHSRLISEKKVQFREASNAKINVL